MHTTEITVSTGRRPGLFDLTRACEQFIAQSIAQSIAAAAPAADGLLNVFVPHATAGLVIVELGAGSETDVMAALDRLLPRDSRWTHQHGSAGHGADHVLPLLAPPSLTIPVVGGRLALGTWQSIALLDTNVDNERRTVRLSFIDSHGA
jgi:secondary thiamine-phosphate synthase enzyme